MTDAFGVRVLKRADGKRAHEPMALEKGGRYAVGASWSEGSRDVDIDLQCVVVDDKGIIIDCAYYNNLKAVRSITHSGDEVAGRSSNIEEMVWVNFQRLPANVGMLVFVVAAYSGGTLQNVQDGKLHVFEGSEENEQMCFEMEKSNAAVDVVAVMTRRSRGDKNAHLWGYLQLIDVPAQSGRHFMDILPLLGHVIRGFMPSARKTRQKVAFAMEKGGALDLPSDLAKIVVGLGWDVDDGECDLDVSAVLLDANGCDLEAVFFGRLESKQNGIKHTGDNLTGEGEGDDEQIIVQLNNVGADVHQIFFVVNIYTPGRTFRTVAAPYCRVVDEKMGSELCRYALHDAGVDNGLIVAKLVREAGERWGFHALGLPCSGTIYKDSLPKIRSICNMKTSSLLARSNSSGSLSGAAPTSHAACGARVGSHYQVPSAKPQGLSQACAIM